MPIPASIPVTAGKKMAYTCQKPASPSAELRQSFTVVMCSPQPRKTDTSESIIAAKMTYCILSVNFVLR